MPAERIEDGSTFESIVALCFAPTKAGAGKLFAIIFWLLGAPLAQLDRASGYEPEGREFESLRARHLSLTLGSTYQQSLAILRTTKILVVPNFVPTQARNRI